MSDPIPTQDHRLPERPFILDREPPCIIPREFVPVELRWQLWHDALRNTNRDLRWYGTCIVCERNVWAFDDGKRGDVLGDNELRSVTNGALQARTCAVCANDPDASKIARFIIVWLAIGWEVIRWPGMDR